jgi:uncharacterized delta-60 repeat protein
VGIAKSLAARSDGSLRVGYFAGDAGVLALFADGTIDTGFGSNGRRTIPYNVGGTDRIVAVLERGDGRLVVVLRGDDDFDRTPVLARLTAGGDLDTTFDGDGLKEISFSILWDSVLVLAAALQPDGKIVLAGRCVSCISDGESDSFVARFLATGATDADFGSNGWAVFDAVEGGTDSDMAYAVLVQPDGRIVVGGRSDDEGLPRPYVARRLATGGPDPDYAGNDGIRTLTALPEQWVTALGYDAERRRVVVATGDGTAQFPGVAALARLTESGSLDTLFSGDGILPLSPGGETYIGSVFVQSDRKVVGVGSNDPAGTQVSSFFLARATSGGGLDASFDGDGYKSIEFDLDDDGLDKGEAAALSGGRVVAVGSAVAGGVSQVAVVRTASSLILKDGFERADVSGWETP